MAEETRWAPIWTDRTIIEAVLMQSSNLFEKIQKSGSLKFSFPNFEYDYKPTEQKLYFQDEVDLAEKLKIDTIEEIFNKIKNMETFKPFVVHSELELVFTLDLPEYFRYILNYLLKIPEVLQNHKDEIRALVFLPREILQNKVLESGSTTRPFPFALADRYILPILPMYSGLDKIITDLAVRDKIAIKNSFRGEDYIVYFISQKDKPSDFCAYFPILAQNSLPNEGNFTARIIGIVSFSVNLPLGKKGGFPFFIRAVSLFMPFKVKQQRSSA
jgi:hypothetical protein